MRKAALYSISILVLAGTVRAQQLAIEKIADVQPHPTQLVAAPGDHERLFVTDISGKIWVVENGTVLPQPFLDIEDGLAPRGLMSLAFHPDYQTNGRCFVVYVDDQLLCQIVEYHVPAGARVADPASAVEIFGPFEEPSILHNWNQLVFGPDGMLYVPTGDGALNGDPGRIRAQDVATPHGKILRLDVDIPYPHIPPDNPYVGVPGANERVWALGLRNPWRIDFDPIGGALYIADVGSSTREELNVLPIAAVPMANFGWPCHEGTGCTSFWLCDPMCGEPNWVDPVHEFMHDEGRCAIIGGHVYRGAAMPWLHGVYFFADRCTSRIWSFRWAGGQMQEFTERTTELMPSDGASILPINSFGLDADGELHIIDQGGGIWKIVKFACGETGRFCLTSPNSVGSGATIAKSGSLSMSANDFTLVADGCPPGQFGIFAYGFDTTLNPLGNGVFCLDDPFYRLSVEPIDPAGHLEHALDFSVLPAAIPPGAIVHFQLWYRDPAAGSSGTFNFSDGLAANFCP